MNPFYEIYWYGFWWLLFIAIAFVGSRYFGRRGIIFGAVALAIIIYNLDWSWIIADMREHPEHERDLDFVFMLGVLLRTVLFNIVLLPVTFIGLKLRARSLSVKHDTKVA
jgi:hypothetical protein